MADIKISELTAITGANTAADDELVIVDTSADETKKISRAELLTGIGALPLTGGTLTGTLNINNSTGYANLEMGGPSGAFIDFKSPNSDDKDARIIYGGSNFIIGTNLNQPVIIQHNNSTKLNTSATGVAITGNLDASDGVFIGGTNSYIYEGAANQLNFRIGADGPYAEMIDVGGGVMEFGNAGGELALTAGGTERARVTSSGLELTGTVTSGAATISSFKPTLTLEDTVGGAQDNAEILADSSILRFRNGTSDTTRMQVSLASGDVSFFEDTGTTVKFFWDASAEALGIGTSSPTATLDVVGNVVSQVSINAQTGTTYTTVLADQSKLVTLTNASAITLTIPANSSVAYPVGTKIDFAQLGAGQVTFAGAGGVTVNSTPTLKLRDQYSGASCIKTATDTWLLVGDLATS